MQCHNPEAVALMMKTFNETGKIVCVLKFDAKLEPVKENHKEFDKELDKDFHPDY